MRNTILTLVVAMLTSSAPASAEERLARLRQDSYVATHSAQVLHAFIKFSTARGVEQQQDRLTTLRDRDALLLPAGTTPSARAGSYGALMMGASIVLAAHAPARLRPIFDGRVHAGPALLDGGGMGAGVAGRF
jgi:hypothetical protein